MVKVKNTSKQQNPQLTAQVNRLVCKACSSDLRARRELSHKVLQTPQCYCQSIECVPAEWTLSIFLSKGIKCLNCSAVKKLLMMHDTLQKTKWLCKPQGLNVRTSTIWKVREQLYIPVSKSLSVANIWMERLPLNCSATSPVSSSLPPPLKKRGKKI